MTTGATVYVVREESWVCESVCSLTESMGYRAQRFSSADDFLEIYDELDRGCVVTDLRLPDMSGLDLLDATIKRPVPLPVIVTADHPDTSSTVQAMKRGAITMLELPFQDSELRAAIGEAIGRNEADLERHQKDAVIEARLAELTEKENGVMQLMLQGLANKIIAKQLNVSVRTVESRRHDVFAKMQVHSLAELVRDVLSVRR